MLAYCSRSSSEARTVSPAMSRPPSSCDSSVPAAGPPRVAPAEGSSGTARAHTGAACTSRGSTPPAPRRVGSGRPSTRLRVSRRPPWTAGSRRRPGASSGRSEQLAQRGPWSAPDRRGRPAPGAGMVIVALVQVFGTRAAAVRRDRPDLDRTGYLLLLAGPLALVVRDAAGRWSRWSARSRPPPPTSASAIPTGPGSSPRSSRSFTALARRHRLADLGGRGRRVPHLCVFAVLIRGRSPPPSPVVLIGRVVAGHRSGSARPPGSAACAIADLARDWSAQQQLASAEEEKARGEQPTRGRPARSGCGSPASCTT